MSAAIVDGTEKPPFTPAARAVNGIAEHRDLRVVLDELGVECSVE
jgi:hypothetical protein